MKLVNLVLLGLLLAGAISAQTPTTPAEPSGITVLKHSWQKDVYVPALFDDPMSPNQEQVNLRRQQRLIKRANTARIGAGQAPLPQPTRDINTANREIPEGPSINYIYEAKVRNESAKTIKLIIWEYLVFDPSTLDLVGRHAFFDDSRIRPGKVVTLMGYTTSPPNSIILADKSGKNAKRKFEERIVISRIEFEDGTFWQRPPE